MGLRRKKSKPAIYLAVLPEGEYDGERLTDELSSLSLLSVALSDLEEKSGKLLTPEGRLQVRKLQKLKAQVFRVLADYHQELETYHQGLVSGVVVRTPSMIDTIRQTKKLREEFHGPNTEL